jgi:hypothetical protein
VVAVGEPGDVADLDQQPGGAGGADAVQIHQRAAGGGDQFGELFVRGLGPLVDALEVADQFGGHAAMLGLCRRQRTHLLLLVRTPAELSAFGCDRADFRRLLSSSGSPAPE